MALLAKTTFRREKAARELYKATPHFDSTAPTRRGAGEPPAC